MPDISIRRKHGMSFDDAKAAVEEVARDLGRKLQIDYRMEDNTLSFKGKGVSGTISLDHTDVVFEAKLAMMMKVLRPTLEAAVHKNLDEYLA